MKFSTRTSSRSFAAQCSRIHRTAALAASFWPRPTSVTMPRSSASGRGCAPTAHVLSGCRAPWAKRTARSSCQMVPGSSSVVCTEELGAKKPEDLAVVLGDDLDRYVRAVGKIHSQVLQVWNLLSKAQGIQRAMRTDFNKAAVEVQQEAAEQKTTRGLREPDAGSLSSFNSQRPDHSGR